MTETNLKAIFRLAKAQMALKEYTTAITTLENALEGNKSNENDKDNDSNGKDNDKDNDNDENDNDDNEKSSNKQQGREEIQKLLEIALAYQLKTKNNLSNANTLAKLKTLKNQPIQYHHHNDTGIPKDYKPSIREFKILADLGEGNYSSVVAVRHIVTKETFALKIIEKKKCEDLAKRQHPNVWNEIEMERKILSDRLWNEEEDQEEKGKKKYTWCRRIVQLYHTFVDYR
jgi:tetratricopeptide (TPR) repeat protein